MKNLKHTLAILVATLFVLTSCETNDDLDPPISEPFDPPSAEAFKTIQEDAFNELKQNASFNAEDGINFQSEAGVSLSISPNCLTLNGNPVTGEVDLEYVEVFDRGNMLTTNSTTVGEDANGDRGQLVSGGEFHIRAYQNGEELELGNFCGMMLEVPTSITGGEVTGMGPFSGEIDENDNLIWLQQETEFWVGENNNSSLSYNALVQNFGWFNCDAFYFDPDPKTEIQITVPQGFHNNNSRLYLARVGEANSLGFTNGTFPVGLEAYIIFLSVEDGEFRYAIQTITIEDGQQVIFTLEDTSIASAEDLTQIINDLP